MTEQLRDVTEILTAVGEPPAKKDDAVPTDGAPSLSPGSRIGHYRIGNRLGAGGMGAVYQAFDTALERPVAIKLTHRHLLAGDRDFLKREMAAFSRLQHPSIATFHEAVTDGELAGLVMELVEGEPLSDLLAGGPLDEPSVQQLATSLLWALGHAHAAGVIHRDIRPANIMRRADGSFCILDFGIAKLTQTPHLPDDEHQTQAGQVVGSAGYMPPEQLYAAQVSEATDIFAAAAVLLEAASGKPVFPGASVGERIRNTIESEPQIDPGCLPGPVIELLSAALAREPEQRPGSAPALLLELQQVWQGATAEQPAPGGVLVLAEDNRASGAELDWMATALNNSVKAALGAAGQVKVIPDPVVADQRGRMSAEGPGDGQIDATALARQLGARWLVETRLSGRDGGLTVGIGLHDLATDSLVGEEVRQCNHEQLFVSQAELVEWLCGRLRLESRRPSTRFWTPAKLSETECLARGDSAFNRGGKDGLVEAERHYRQALSANPECYPAMCGLARVLSMRYTFTSDPAVLEEAADYCYAAVMLNENGAEPRVWLSYIRMRQLRFEKSIQEADIAIGQGGPSSMASYFAACSHSALGRWSEAMKAYQASLQVDPNRCWTWMGLANCHFELGASVEAEWSIRKAIELETAGVAFPTAGCEAFLAEFLRVAGKLDEAWAACRRSLERLEDSDFIYRDTFRALALRVLANIALDRDDPQAAERAFEQAITGLKGRPNAVGCGQLLIQCTAGLAGLRGDRDMLVEAHDLFSSRPEPWNFEFAWGCTDNESVYWLRQARDRLARQS